MLPDQSNVERERDVAILERDEMRRANVTPEDADRPLGQSVEYWQDRCLDHATALDNMRIRAIRAEGDRDRYRDALEDAVQRNPGWRARALAVLDQAASDDFGVSRGDDA